VTFDSMLEIALAVGIPGLMALIGGALAARALPTEPGKKNLEMWYWISGFMFLFLFSIILAFVQQIRATAKERATEQKTQQVELRSRGEVKYMEGQLDTMNRVLGTLATNSDPKQNALLFKALLSASSTSKRDPVSLGNLALRCSELANNIMRFAANQQNEEPYRGGRDRRNAWIKTTDERFRGSYYPDVKELRDRLKALNFEDTELNHVIDAFDAELNSRIHNPKEAEVNPEEFYISVGGIKQIGASFIRLADQLRSAK
jgi:hypothetical protein